MKKRISRLHLALLRWLNRFVNNHPSNRFTVFLLFRGVDPVSRGIHGKTVDRLLHVEILEPSIVGCTFCLKDRYEATRTSGIDPSQARVELHNVGPCRQRKMRNRLVSIQSSDSFTRTTA
jgi:hypothetical protein